MLYGNKLQGCDEHVENQHVIKQVEPQNVIA